MVETELKPSCRVEAKLNQGCASGINGRAAVRQGTLAGTIFQAVMSVEHSLWNVSQPDRIAPCSGALQHCSRRAEALARCGRICSD